MAIHCNALGNSYTWGCYYCRTQCTQQINLGFCSEYFPLHIKRSVRKMISGYQDQRGRRGEGERWAAFHSTATPMGGREGGRSALVRGKIPPSERAILWMCAVECNRRLRVPLSVSNWGATPQTFKHYLFALVRLKSYIALRIWSICRYLLVQNVGQGIEGN